MSKDPTAYFGDAVFNDHVMRTRLSSDTYRSLKETIEAGEPLDSSIAGEVAAAIKQWAVEQGATHYTHWFMPLSGTTGEKHEAFLQPLGNGKVILDFSGKALIKGEPDASSFPSGGLRETAAARGYTAWDCTSPAFVKDKTLYIPTAFFSHTGEVLDKKAPLLRSTEALNRQALRLLRLFGNTTARQILVNIGPEQEYFLIDRDTYRRRPDLRATGRTLFGAPPAKGQELSDHYYGVFADDVSAFMQDLDETLWHLGVAAHTKHNEVAPCQHELAVVFSPCSMAVDQNLLVMEQIQKIALRHNLVALLHNKPFEGLAGSGKHVNWSLATDTGENLLDPGEDVTTNIQFLTFLGAVIKALDTHGDLLLFSISDASNEHRLGSHEAPPPILSMTVGEELQSVIDCIEAGKPLVRFQERATNLGVNSISLFTVDTTDRNRTSPFAFTGNRFEFRMPGAKGDVAAPCYILNTILAEALSDLADALTGAEDIKTAALNLFKEIIMRHKRVIYNGDNYADSWAREAERRGLLRLESAVTAIHRLIDQKNINVLASQNVLTEEESRARHDVLLENYSNEVALEARTAIEMVHRDIYPACLADLQAKAAVVGACESASPGSTPASLADKLQELSELVDAISEQAEVLEEALRTAADGSTELGRAELFSTEVKTALSDLRAVVDRAETRVARKYWPYPCYGEILNRLV